MGTSSTNSSVNASTVAVTLLASNSNRVSATIVNESDEVLRVRCAADANVSDYRYRLEKWDTCDIDDYDGVISGIWESPASLQARITEVT